MHINTHTPTYKYIWWRETFLAYLWQNNLSIWKIQRIMIQPSKYLPWIPKILYYQFLSYLCNHFLTSMIKNYFKGINSLHLKEKDHSSVPTEWRYRITLLFTTYQKSNHFNFPTAGKQICVTYVHLCAN